MGTLYRLFLLSQRAGWGMEELEWQIEDQEELKEKRHFRLYCKSFLLKISIFSLVYFPLTTKVIFFKSYFQFLFLPEYMHLYILMLI